MRYYSTVTALQYRISHHYSNEYRQSANIWDMVIVSGQMQIIVFPGEISGKKLVVLNLYDFSK